MIAMETSDWTGKSCNFATRRAMKRQILMKTNDSIQNTNRVIRSVCMWFQKNKRFPCPPTSLGAMRIALGKQAIPCQLRACQSCCSLTGSKSSGKPSDSVFGSEGGICGCQKSSGKLNDSDRMRVFAALPIARI